MQLIEENAGDTGDSDATEIEQRGNCHPHGTAQNQNRLGVD
jgi:hypothetical protein